MKKISNLWVSHLSPKGDDREEFKEYLGNQSQILEALDYILLKELNHVHEDMASETSYHNQDWQFLQAHRNGKLEVLTFLLKLTEHKTS